MGIIIRKMSLGFRQMKIQKKKTEVTHFSM